MTKSLCEILGVSDEPVELFTVTVDHKSRTVSVEYLGPNGTAAKDAFPAIVVEWADGQDS